LLPFSVGLPLATAGRCFLQIGGPRWRWVKKAAIRRFAGAGEFVLKTQQADRYYATLLAAQDRYDQRTSLQPSMTFAGAGPIN